MFLPWTGRSMRVPPRPAAPPPYSHWAPISASVTYGYRMRIGMRVSSASFSGFSAPVTLNPNALPHSFGKVRLAEAGSVGNPGDHKSYTVCSLVNDSGPARRGKHPQAGEEC